MSYYDRRDSPRAELLIIRAIHHIWLEKRKDGRYVGQGQAIHEALETLFEAKRLVKADMKVQTAKRTEELRRRLGGGIAAIVLALALALALAAPHARAQQGGAQAGRRLESRHGPHFAFLRSRAFWWRMGVMGGAALADGITTEQLIRRGGYEQNPLMGRYPSSARMFTEGSAMEVTGAWLAWRESRSPDPRARWLSRLVPVAVAGMQVTLAIQNTRLVTSESEHIAKTVRSAEAAP